MILLIKNADNLNLKKKNISNAIDSEENRE